MPKPTAVRTEPRHFAWLLLSDIYVDKDWNVRHESHFAEVTDTPDEVPDNEDGRGTHLGIVSLADSIAAQGQETPILVRPSPNPKAYAKTPYHLIAGHRRVAALKLLARQVVPTLPGSPHWSPKTPVVWAEVRRMSDSEALLANLTENTARDELTVADTAFGVHRLFLERGRDKASKGAIARATGKSERYIGRLLNVMERADTTVTGHWRVSRKPLPLTHLEAVSALPLGEQRGAYDRFCQGGALHALPGKSNSGNGRSPKPQSDVDAGEGDAFPHVDTIRTHIDNALDEMVRAQETVSAGLRDALESRIGELQQLKYRVIGNFEREAQP